MVQKIVIADDQPIFRTALKALLSSYSELEVVGEAGDGLEAIRAAEKFRPSLMLIDISMPKLNGIEAIREIKRRFSETKILILTAHNTEDYLHAALKAGADGYVLKVSAGQELTLAIRSVLNGGNFISPELSGKVIQGYLKPKKPSPEKLTPWQMVTPREKAILKLIAEGYRNKEIAGFLYISVKTVEKHRSNLMKKLGLHRPSALKSLAIEKGLLTKEEG